MNDVSTAKVKNDETGQVRLKRGGNRSRQLLRVLVALLTLAVVLGIGARPGYRKLKRMRALSRVQGLEDPKSTVPAEEAVNRLRIALLVAPGDPDVLRIAARMYSRLRLRQAVDHWSQYLGTGRATDEEHLEACGVAIAEGRPDLGRAWLEELVARMPEDPRILTPLFQLAIRWGAGAGAEKVARRRVALAPGDAEARMDLGLLLLASPAREARDEGVGELATVACQEGAVMGLRQRALGALSLSMAPGHPMADRVLQSSRAMAESSLEAQLVHWDLEVKADPGRGAGLLREARERARKEGAPEQRARIAFWLAGRGGAQEAIDLLPLDFCTNQVDAAVVRLDCLLVLGRNDEVTSTLDACEPVLPAGCRDSMLGSMAVRRGDTNAAEVSFRKAIQVASAARDLRTAEYVAQEGARFGMTLVALEALESVLPLSREPLPIARRMAVLLQRVPDLERVLQALRLASRVLPQEPSVGIERAWHELYLGRSTAWCVEELGRLVKSGPATRDLQMAYAFALFRAGDANGAQRVMEAEVARAEDPAWLPRHLIVRIQIMGATGQREGARTLARSLPLGGVRQEVRMLVEPWL
jgi:uncharacterized protein HemY